MPSENDPINKTDPTGLDVFLSGNRAMFTLSLINFYSETQYLIGENGRLMVNPNKLNASGSGLYSAAINRSIASENSAQIFTSTAVKLLSGEIALPGRYGQGMTLSPERTGVPREWAVVISGKSNVGDIKDQAERPLSKGPAEILVHEIVGHLDPQMRGQRGNADVLENKVRQELRLPLVEERPTHFSSGSYSAKWEDGHR